MTKTCSKCELPLDIEAFGLDASRKDGRTSWCRECENARQREWRRGNLDKTHGYARSWRINHPFRSTAQPLVRQARKRSKDRGMEFSLTSDWVEMRLRATPECPVCGMVLQVGPKENGKTCDASPSMDRLDPRQGYTEADVHVICWRCNRAKSDATLEELERLVAWIKQEMSPV